LDYEGLDPVGTAVGDFDLPAIWDPAAGEYRALNVKNAKDLALIKTTSANQWLKNYGYSIEAIDVTNGGSGYSRAPTVTIVGGGGTGAKAVAVINAGTGKVVGVDVITPGTGYTSQPTVVFSTGNGKDARAYVRFVQTSSEVDYLTQNKTVRTIKTQLSFDRTTYNSSVSKWKSYTTYHPGDIVIVEDVTKSTFVNLPDQQLPSHINVYRVLKKILGTETLDLNLFNNTTVVQKLSGTDIDNAIDRVAIYNRPGSPDVAVLYSSPDTQRLDASATNDQAASSGNEWNCVVHSSVVPATHEYQYLSVGNRALVAISKNGTDWSIVPIAENFVNLRDACFYNGTTWVAVGNQATLLLSDNGTDWSKEVVNEFRFSPSADNPGGAVQVSASQAIDFTSVAYVDSTRANYVVAVGNGNNILVNPYSTSLDIAQGWYSAKPQPGIFTVPNQMLKVLSTSYGDLTNIDGTTYSVNLQISGYFTEGTGGRNMQEGFVIVGGTNGNFYITSYARLDDLMQGYSKRYNYDAGKKTDLNYPWVPMSAPLAVLGDSDGVSGEQITDIALSDSSSRWIVAVGSAGTLIWNKVDSPIQLQDGSIELASDTAGSTVVNHGIEVFNNFREFNADDFEYPLTKDVISKINFTGVVFDGEKFVVAGDDSTVIWGYPGNQDEAYIEMGNLNPTTVATTRSASASWSAATNATSLVVSVPKSAIDGPIIADMLMSSTYLPDDSVVVSYTAGTMTDPYTSTTVDAWLITINFATASVVAKTEQQLVMSFVFLDDIPSGTALTFAGPNGATKVLTTSRAASKSDTVVYVSGFADVGANWTITGTGMPTGATVKAIGKFAKFTWKFAKGSGRDVNINYNSLSVNRTTIQLSTPFTEDIPAGSVITFFDSTGTKSQATTSQALNKNTTTLCFDDTAGIEVGFVLEANSAYGIVGGTAVASTRTYNIAGVLDHLAKDIPDLIPGTSYDGVKVQGQAYTNTATDLLSLDTNIKSEYTDTGLGIRPEDIIIQGGKFIDTYSSHAPEELVPGQVIDSLQMNVFTANVASGTPDYSDVIGYKIFTDYKLPTVYYRLSADATTTLAANLAYDATEIAVTNINALPDPNRTQNQPGSIWIAGERINYFGRDVQRGVLTDIRRGASRTSIPVTHVAGSIITDASPAQEVGRDTVLAITENLSVNNGFSGTANTAIYQSAVTTEVPQGKIWLNRA
jgi:hypothetical protein